MSTPPAAPDDRESLKAFLAERDTACPGCGYNLRGLPSDRCPECNQELVLAVRLAEPKIAAWVTGLVGLACGVGFSGLLLAFMFTAQRGMPRSEIYRFFYCTGGPFVVEGIALLAWVWCRRGIGRLSPPARIGLVIACWVLTVTNFAVFTASIK